MAAFDPDAYLAKSTPTAPPQGFDPDAYLRLKTPPGEIPGTLYRGDQPQPEVPRSFMQRALGTAVAPLDVALTLASGAARSSWLNPVIGAVTGQTAEQVAAGARQPQTPEARALLEAAGPAMQSLIGVAPMTPIGPAGAARPALRAVGDVARAEGEMVAAPVQAALQARREAAQQVKVAKSYANAPVIDAANAAQRQGLAVDPAVTNPTIGNRFKNMTVGPAFNEAAVKHNAQQVTNLVRKDLGVAAEEGLTPDAVNRALDKASEPVKTTLAKIPEVSVDSGTLTKLEALNRPAVIGGEPQAAATAALIKDAQDKLAAGRSGQQVWDDIRSLRRNAQATYKAQKTLPDPVKTAQADTQMAIANILEDALDANAPSIKSLSDMRAARQRMAQIYDHERAIDFANQTVDPQAYAKMLSERQGRMTGVGADIGKVASTFPSLMTTVEPAPQALPRVARSGVTGAAGALLGGAVGGYPGAIAGATLGGGLGHVGQRVAARTMVTPEYQAARAVPQDYRPPVNMLRPAEVRPYGEPNQLVPYAAQEVLMPGEGPYTPNWVYARPAPFRVGVPEGPLQLPAPSAESTMAALRAEQARPGGMDATLAAAKAREMAQGFEEIAARARTAQAKRDAMAEREKLMDFADQLDEQLRKERKKPSTGQGPKTRAAKRNALAPEPTNNLAP